MSKETLHDKIESKLGLFIYLIGVEILIAGIPTAVFAAELGSRTIAIAASVLAALGAASLFIPKQLGGQRSFLQRITSGIQNRFAGFIPLAVVLVVTLSLFALDLSTNIVRILSPILICVWLIGVEFLLFFQRENKSIETSDFSALRKGLTFLGVILAIGIVVIPTRIPSLLDGIPLETPFEFIVAAILLPFAFIVGNRFFVKKIVLTLLGFLLAVKVIALFLLPQAGLGVRTYSSEEAFSNGKWEKSYGTFFNPSYTQVTQLPYYGYREFPIEWINRNGFNPDDFWVALDLNGFVHLQKNERLVFVVEGADQAQVAMVDAAGHQTISGAVVENAKEINANLYQEIPEMQDFKLQATLAFKTFGQYRVEPLILYPDGSTKSALALSKIWISPNNADVNLFQPLLDLVGIALAVLLMAGLVIGILDLYRVNKVNAIDVYLMVTALPAFYVACLVPRPEMNIALISFIVILASVKVLDHSISRRGFSWREIFISIGPVFLAIFLVLTIYNLRDVVIFPQKQDGLEYQILTRNIFINGDVFLTQTPPRAYKVLFPYLVGFLHILFGQSASAQLFLNTWCALVGSLILSKLADSFRLPARTSIILSASFLLILCLPSSYIFYFRFGLIEPTAILFLLATYTFAMNRNIPGMIVAGILAALLRLDYLGAILAAVILTADPMIGTVNIVWKQFADWIKISWKTVATYFFSVMVTPLLVILGYYLFIPGYALTASNNNQASLWSVLQSLFIVVFGGDPAELRTKFLENPLDAALITVPVAFGFLIVLISLFYRKGFFNKIDLRLSLLMLGILPAYIFVQPTAYFPRYSWAPLPLALIIVGIFLSYLFRKNENQL